METTKYNFTSEIDENFIRESETLGLGFKIAPDRIVIFSLENAFVIAGGSSQEESGQDGPFDGALVYLDLEGRIEKGFYVVRVFIQDGKPTNEFALVDQNGGTVYSSVMNVRPLELPASENREYEITSIEKNRGYYILDGKICIRNEWKEFDLVILL